MAKWPFNNNYCVYASCEMAGVWAARNPSETQGNAPRRVLEGWGGWKFDKETVCYPAVFCFIQWRPSGGNRLGVGRTLSGFGW